MVSLSWGGEMTIKEAIFWARELLDSREGWRLDAELLLAESLALRRLDLMAHPERDLTPAELTGYHRLLKRRAQDEPIAYIIGRREFFGRDFLVGPGVLIPRPETEALVELGLEFCAKIGRPARIFDLGTGSGALAITMALELPGSEVWASDLSPWALGWAYRNAKTMLTHAGSRDNRGLKGRDSSAKNKKNDNKSEPDLEFGEFLARGELEIGRLKLIHGDLFAGVSGSFDLILSNPPYLGADELVATPADVKNWEPEEALVAEEGGLAVYRRIIEQVPARLAPGGSAVFELDAGVAKGVEALAREAGFSFRLELDLAGLPRVAILKTLSG